MEEATLLEWKVGPGDQVKEGEPIAEVSTDKVDMDLESPFTGVIAELLVEAGGSVALGGILATIETEADDFLAGLDLGGEEAASDEAPLPAPPPTLAEAAPAPAKTGIIAASPPARKLARELGINLAAVTPTGARGQVTPADVKHHNDASIPAPPTVPAQEKPIAVPAAESGADGTRRLAVRRATATIMGHSAAIPQFTLYRTLVLDRAAAVRGERSWTTELVRALAGALRQSPELNARWDVDTERPVPWDALRIGLAVDRPGAGLVVAAIEDPDLAAPAAADATVRAVADRARTGKLRPEDMAQPSITLSNLGGLGVERFNALLFPPQASILSAGTIAMRPVATPDGGLKAALTVEVGLTIDHRVADGADGARLLGAFAELLEG
jgi:pyruvate dehydrogenase E2 component (dihydrolipoamide acetyltransferase)